MALRLWKATLTACPGRLTLSQLSQSCFRNWVGAIASFGSPGLNLPIWLSILKTLVQRADRARSRKLLKLASNSNFSRALASAASGQGSSSGETIQASPLDRRSGPEGRSRPSQCRCATATSGQISRQETASDSREDVQSKVSLYLGQLQGQLSHLEGITQSLVERQNQLTQRLEAPAPSSQETLTNRKALINWPSSCTKLKRRFSSSSTGNRDWEASEQTGPLTDWMVLIFPTDSGAGEAETRLSSRRALEMAIDQAQRRLYIVWPWSSAITMDEDLLKRFTPDFWSGVATWTLAGATQGDTHEGRLIGRISQRWATESNQLVPTEKRPQYAVTPAGKLS